MPEEQIILHSPGALPGIPGEHAAGVYLVDYEARTIRPYVPNAEEPPEETEPPVSEEVSVDPLVVPVQAPASEPIALPVEPPLIDLSAFGG